MKTGDVVLVPFPFAELTQVKARPAVVIAETADKYRDIIVCSITSVLDHALTRNEFRIFPSTDNGLRVESIVKVDRIVTTKVERVIARLGTLSNEDRVRFLSIFRELASA